MAEKNRHRKTDFMLVFAAMDRWMWLKSLPLSAGADTPELPDSVPTGRFLTLSLAFIT
jgi:hypothetical protein